MNEFTCPVVARSPSNSPNNGRVFLIIIYGVLPVGHATLPPKTLNDGSSEMYVEKNQRKKTVEREITTVDFRRRANFYLLFHEHTTRKS